VFLVQLSLGRAGELAVFAFGLIPARLLGRAELSPALDIFPAWATIFTSMLMHGGWLHLGGNMLFLWIFGDNVEDSMGHTRFLVFYLLCGLAAGLTQAYVSPDSVIPMVGASGAISGILGAYLLLHPQATVRTLVFLGFFVTIIHVPALIVLGLWFIVQFWSAAAAPLDEPGVAFWAHVGGFVAGLILVLFFRRSGVALLQGPRSIPFERERFSGPWGGL
jgi:membrane associated rhomboid family serine protease